MLLSVNKTKPYVYSKGDYRKVTREFYLAGKKYPLKSSKGLGIGSKTDPTEIFEAFSKEDLTVKSKPIQSTAPIFKVEVEPEPKKLSEGKTQWIPCPC